MADTETAAFGAADQEGVGGYRSDRRGNHTATRTALTEAIDLFKRLGMRRELAETREELALLELTIARQSSTSPCIVRPFGICGGRQMFSSRISKPNTRDIL